MPPPLGAGHVIARTVKSGCIARTGVDEEAIDGPAFLKGMLEKLFKRQHIMPGASW
jgi:hypothetical protein